jgi:hypothetical protein
MRRELEGYTTNLQGRNRSLFHLLYILLVLVGLFVFHTCDTESQTNNKKQRNELEGGSGSEEEQQPMPTNRKSCPQRTS